MTTGETGSGNPRLKTVVLTRGSTPTTTKDVAPVKEEAPITPNPLFDKIRATLQRTEPSKWRRSGEDFNREAKNPKPVEVWETLFLLPINEGNLVLRCSIPLKSEYFGGGYTLIPVCDPRFTVEIREKGWNPRELTDPFFSNSQKKHLKMQKLLEGKMARVLFEEVRMIVENFNSDKRTHFERQCFELMANLLERIPQMPYDIWKREEQDAHLIRYHSPNIDGLTVDIARVDHQGRVSFHLKMSRDGMHKSMASSQVEDIFVAIEELGRDASLTQLGKLLDTLDI